MKAMLIYIYIYQILLQKVMNNLLTLLFVHVISY
jgi:hypothetical protein